MRSGIAFFLILFAAAAAAAQPIDLIRKSVVRVSVAAQAPNYRVPWDSGQVERGTGAGFVIAGNRIMTNAHVVSNARLLVVERENDPKQYVATVEHVAHDCDLAVLKVGEPAFFSDAAPFEFGGIPEIESGVSVYGYPIGGDRLSVTEGIVSRIDFSTYSHSGIDAHLVVQIDAAINPGNSGGPVMRQDRVVGVAFQGYRGDFAQNVGYMIPVPVIQRFLRDIEDGSYDHYMDLAVGIFRLQNPSMRKALGLANDDRGVMVSSVAPSGCSAGILMPGDVILSIDGHPVASDGALDLEGARVEMAEVVERKVKGDQVALGVLREGKAAEVTVKLDVAWPFMIQANRYNIRPRYVVFAGLLFQPLSKDFLDAYHSDDTRVRYFFENFIGDRLYVEHPEVVLLSGVMSDPINTYVQEFAGNIIESINGKKIRKLDDVAAAFDAPQGAFHVIDLLGKNRPIVLGVNDAKEAHERVMRRYDVRGDRNLED
jgi:S1-C subfamily serine protease